MFVIMTEDGSGTGWVKKLLEEGEDVALAYRSTPEEENEALFERVGEGWFTKVTVEEAVKKFSSPSTVWIPDRNCFPDVCDELRARGQKVFFITPLTAKMELDRQFAVEIADEYGLYAPPTHEFKNIDDALEFLDANLKLAFVFKPNASELNYLTFVPCREEAEDANRELYSYLVNLTAGAEHGFILQERKSGVEANVETWWYRGRPFFAMITLENKRRWNHDLGEMCGCASDVVFSVPLESKIITTTVGRMFPFYQKQAYSGFADVNVIIGDGEVWFLEVCNRLGYSAHPNLFLGLAMDGFGLIMSDWITGAKELVNNAYDRFRLGFGASITCFHDHPRFGLPLYLRPRSAHQFYVFDGCKPHDDLLLTGYSSEVGAFVDHDYTIEQAAENCLMKLLHQEAVSFPDMCFRTDLGRADYPGSVIKRYSALKSMALL